ncbi:hypothetical protein ABZ695_28915 [Streptomyces sp. NPDC006976]|uniref:hypothetical protein n=1 Tax=Streptomyces sp. NPDC006976 TaxID=3154311 RepID=UPI0033E28A45
MPTRPTRPARTDIVAGRLEDLVVMLTNYRCGHCTGHVEGITTNDTTGAMHARVEHDTGCPVLTGSVSPIPDTFRALTDQQ